MIKLTDKEIREAVRGMIVISGRDMDASHDIAQAQLRKVWEWGNEDCREPAHVGRRYSQLKWGGVSRRMCLECWQELRREAEEVKE